MVRKHWVKEKLLLMSIFSFSHCVFKRLVLQTCKNSDCLGKGPHNLLVFQTVSIKIRPYTTCSLTLHLQYLITGTVSQSFSQMQNFGLHQTESILPTTVEPSPKALVFMCLQYKSFEYNGGKRQIAHKEQFLFSHNIFYPFEELSAIIFKFEIIVCKSFSLEESKICRPLMG